MADKVYLLLEEHRFIKPRRFTIIDIFDDPEAATLEYDEYNKLMPSSDYAYEIKLEEWEIKN